jgi:hypothetical protein
MTVDEATKFFMDNWYQGDKTSRQEAAYPATARDFTEG